MSFGTISSASINGLSVELIQVEADISNGLPLLHMVGFLSSEVREAAERVRTAIKNTDILLPAKRIVINLAPGTLKKRGASFDLPIALSILSAMNLFSPDKLEHTIVFGELGLDGSVRKIKGILPMVMAAKDAGFTKCIVPLENGIEATLVDHIEIYGASSLFEILSHLQDHIPLSPIKSTYSSQELIANPKTVLDFSDIHGQEAIKRAAEVAVAGGHNFLMIGPPGSGKTMIASRIPSILPTPSLKTCTDITKIYSVLGLLDAEHPLIRQRPFRQVHHTITKSALIGGGLIPKPGEISLAHEGVLFLDELAEFSKPVLEVLRQPLEEHVIRITRNMGNYIFPANFILVAATNPCPCGNYPNYETCTCTPWQVQQYINHISQPFLDRMDICIEAPKVTFQDLSCNIKAESSAEIRARVEAARNIQATRYQDFPFDCNSQLSTKEIPIFCQLDSEGTRLMSQAYDIFQLTARTYHKVLKISRTIADLDQSEQILSSHLKEALGYRTVDKKYWKR